LPTRATSTRSSPPSPARRPGAHLHDPARPRPAAAGAKVAEANAIVERLAARHGAVVADLRDLTGAGHVWADRVHLTATGQVRLADRAARALGAPLPSQTVVDPPAPDGWYRWHYAKRAVRERVPILVERLRSSR
jgi:hypothetical protein